MTFYKHKFAEEQCSLSSNANNVQIKFCLGGYRYKMTQCKDLEVGDLIRILNYHTTSWSPWVLVSLYAMGGNATTWYQMFL